MIAARRPVTDAPFASLRRIGGALGTRRILAGFATLLVVGPLLTGMLVTIRTPQSITYEVLSYQLLVVVVALIGGLAPALLTAVLSGVTLDLLFVAPQFSITVEDPLHLVALALYIVTAVLVGVIVDRAARRALAADRAADEAELLASVAGHVLRGENAAQALLGRAREAFALAGVRLLGADGEVIARDGEPIPDAAPERVPVGGGVLELHGAPLDARSRRLLDAIVAQLTAVQERTALTAAAREAAVLAETDRVRSALLSAVSHDLRRPLAAAVAAVGGLRAAHALSDSDRAELLATADESLTALSKLVTDLLDVSRVQAGVLAVSPVPTDAGGAVLSALDELALGPDRVRLALDAGLPALRADPVLLQRVLVNLLANAERFSPSDRRVTIETRRGGRGGEILVIDHGPGVPAARRDDVFEPFQRSGDTDNSTGLGLGLALSRGFVEGMAGTLTAEDTPGGGLTMVISLPWEETS